MTFYSEPASAPRFTSAEDGEVIIRVTAIGPTGKTFFHQEVAEAFGKASSEREGGKGVERFEASAGHSEKYRHGPVETEHCRVVKAPDAVPEFAPGHCHQLVSHQPG